MNRNGLVIALLAAFFAGTATGLVGGVLLVHHVLPKPPAEMREGRPGPPHGGREGAMLRRLEHELQLTAEQRESVRRILEEARVSHEATRDSTIAAIERVLTDEQRERWAGIRRQMEKRFGRPRGEALAPPDAPGRP